MLCQPMNVALPINAVLRRVPPVAYAVNDPAVVRYVARATGADDFTAHSSIGIYRHGRVAGGWVFDGYTGKNICLHVAGEGKRWLTPWLKWACFDYVFNQLGLERCSGMIAASNADALKFGAKLGFVEEARLKRAARDGSDLICLVLWREQTDLHTKGKEHYGKGIGTTDTELR